MANQSENEQLKQSAKELLEAEAIRTATDFRVASARCIESALDAHQARLQSSSYEQRRAASEAAVRELGEARARMARLHQAEGKLLEQKYQQQVAAVSQMHEQTSKAQFGRVVRAVYAELGPLVESFRTEPSRRVAGAVHEALVRLNERSAAEAGKSLPQMMIAFVLADSVIAAAPHAVNPLATGDMGSHRIIEFAGRFLVATTPKAMQDALEQLEHELLANVSRVASQTVDSARLSARWEVVRLCDGPALAAFDRDQELARQRNFERTYVPPTRERPGSASARLPPVERLRLASGEVQR